jgi:hypothetical protein
MLRGWPSLQLLYRKAFPRITSIYDEVPLDSEMSILLEVQAQDKFRTDRIDEGAKYHQMALNFQRKAHNQKQQPSARPIPMISAGSINATGLDINSYRPIGYGWAYPYCR